MLYFDRIDISEGVELARSNNNKECMICHYWFFNHRFRFQDSLCNGCNDLTVLCLKISNIIIITDKNVDYCPIIYNISKYETINLLKSAVSENPRYI